ncbi:MAG: hypothetical protein JRI38_03830 [Deltaproteobacteria bacterium]|nr:hypothetical protein [Deltaproteobacteria bacterium]
MLILTSATFGWIENIFHHEGPEEHEGIIIFFFMCLHVLVIKWSEFELQLEHRQEIIEIILLGA